MPFRHFYKFSKKEKNVDIFMIIFVHFVSPLNCYTIIKFNDCDFHSKILASHHPHNSTSYRVSIMMMR